MEAPSPRQSFITALCALSVSLAPGLAAQAHATSPTKYLSAPATHATFEDAIDSYEKGDSLLALTYGRQAAQAGDTQAQVLVGHILLRGETGLIDAPEARKWFSSAADNGNLDAMVALGEMSLRSQAGLVPANAKDYLERAAKGGRQDAMRVLADMYDRGDGVAQDPQKAQDWRQKAVSKGDYLAARAMGDSLIDSDPVSALKWYEKAAAQGDAESAYIAAIMYAETFEIRPDEQKSAVLMRQAATANIAPAMADYGLLIYQGAGVERDINAAAKWFEKAAIAGDSEGQFLYAFTLAKGEGVTQNFEDAYFWLLRSGSSEVDAYNADREALKERLENNVDPTLLNRAKIRFERIKAQ